MSKSEIAVHNLDHLGIVAGVVDQLDVNINWLVTITMNVFNLLKGDKILVFTVVIGFLVGSLSVFISEMADIVFKKNQTEFKQLSRRAFTGAFLTSFLFGVIYFTAFTIGSQAQAKLVIVSMSIVALIAPVAVNFFELIMSIVFTENHSD